MKTKLSSIVKSFYFMFLSIIFISNSCSAQVTPTITQIGVKKAGQSEQIYDCPVTLSFQTGDTVTFRAIVLSPYNFNGWLGDLSGMDNPQTIIITKPSSIKINYSTALSFEVGIANSKFVTEKIFEFEVWVRSFTETFILTAYQVALEKSTLITGSLSFTYVEGTSELSNEPSAGIGINDNKLTFAVGGPGNDTVTFTPKKMGVFRLTSTNNFPFMNMGIDFNFTSPVNTIFTGQNVVDITGFGTFLSLPEKHWVNVKVE